MAVFKQVSGSLTNSTAATTFNGESGTITWCLKNEYLAAMKRLRDWPKEKALQQWELLMWMPDIKKRGTVDAPRLAVIEPPQTLFQAGTFHFTGIKSQQAIEDKAALEQALQCMGDRALESTHKLAQQFAEQAGPGVQSQVIASPFGRLAPVALEDVPAAAGLIDAHKDTETPQPVEEKDKDQSAGSCYTRTHWVFLLVWPIWISYGMLPASEIMCVSS